MPEEFKPKFDATINLGHVLTFIGFIASIFVAWTTLDKRVTALEIHQIHQIQRDDAQDAAVRDQLQAIRQSLQRIEDTQQRLLEGGRR